MDVNSSEMGSFGSLLRALRTARHLTQQQLADRLGVRRNTVGSWERGDFLPGSKAMVLELAKQLRLDEHESRLLLEASLTAPVPYWLVPLARNPYFTGRQDILETLHRQLGGNQLIAPQVTALFGLGGIGKTQVALEYAYRHALEYSAVFWITAETVESITTSMLAIADVLHLPGRTDQDQHQVVVAVQHWFATHQGWLLIWDNIEDFEMLSHFLLPTPLGASLLTTRAQTLGTVATGLEVASMEQEEGLFLLLRRSKMFGAASNEGLHQLAQQQPGECAAATELVEMLGGLPLALDQAGAYIEETRCGLSGYLRRYKHQGQQLLARRGTFGYDHPHSVVTIVRLSCERVAELHPAALEMLFCCVFLAPDAIPEELFVAGADHLGTVLGPVCAEPARFDQVLSALGRLSLVRRQPETQTLALHRLVHVVLAEGLSKRKREQWHQRATNALAATFPETTLLATAATWNRCDRLLSHALRCLRQAGAAAHTREGASLAYKAAQYLYMRGRYTETEQLLLQALRIREQTLGKEHSEVSHVLNYLAYLYYEQGKYTQAETLHLRALHIREHALGGEHPEVASSLSNLANLYQQQGRYQEAEQLYLRALQIHEQIQGPEHPSAAYPLNNLADLYLARGDAQKAATLYRRALHIWEQALGPEHPLIGYPLTGLATLSLARGEEEQADQFYRRALAIWEQALGPEHPDVTAALLGLAELAARRDHQEEAEALYRRALALRKAGLGQDHPETAKVLTGLADLYLKQSKAEQAEPLLQHACTILSEQLGETHPDTLKARDIYQRLLVQKGNAVQGAEQPPIEQVRTHLRAKGWSLHLKSRRGKPYAYATRRVGKRTQSQYLAPLANPAACLVKAQLLPKNEALGNRDATC